MADRTVTYTFRGNFASLAAGLTAAGRGVTDLGVKMTALDKNGAKMRAGLATIGSAAGKVGLVAAAGFAVAVGAAANFEQAMSNVQAATHETSGNMELLRKAAIEAGQATVFSATEAAGAIEELAKAGVSTKDILAGGLSGALDLAAAGGLEVADAAQIAATALTQFRLSGEDVPHVADLLAAGAGKAQGDVSDLSMALKQSGLVASQMGVSIEETTGTLAAFASAGLLGSDAGTSFRTMLLRLANPTEESAALMEQLGIQAYNAQGQFVGIEALAGQLAVAFQGQTQAQRDAALATLFGSDAIRAANVLYNQGAQGIADWTDKVNDQGYAAETAAIKMDNLKGDLEQLRGSLETALIGAGSGSQGPLRQLVQGLTDVVNAFNKLPPSAQHATTSLFGITAVLGGGLWFSAKVIRGVSDTREALDKLGVSATRTGTALKTIGTLGAAATVLLAVEQAAAAAVRSTDKAAPGIERLTRSLLNLQSATGLRGIAQDVGDLSGAIETLSDPGLAQNIGDVYDKVPLIGSAFADMAPGLRGARQEARDAATTINALDEALAGIVSSGSPDRARETLDQLAQAYGLTADQQSDLLKLLPQYKEALAGAANSAQLGAEAEKGYGVAARQSAEAAKQQAAALEDATKAMRDKTSATLAAFDAETGYRQALKDAQEQAKKNSAGIKGSTDAALENRQALSGLASAWNNQSAAVKNNVERYRDARQSFIQTAEAMGVPTAAAKRLADQILEIPKSKVSHVGVDGADAAIGKVQTLNRELSRVVSKTITVTVNTVRHGLAGMQFASGGYTGPGGVNEPAGIVHRGEVVIPQRYVKRDWAMLRARYGDLPGFADGGVVGRAVGSHHYGPNSPYSPLFGIDKAFISIRELAERLDDLSARQLRGLGLDVDDLSKKSLVKFGKSLDQASNMAEKELRLAKDRLDEEKAQLKELRDARRQFMQDVTSNFNTQLFGNVDLVEALRTGQVPSEVLAAIKGTGDNGAVTAEDVQAYLATLSASQIAALQAQANTGILNQNTSDAQAFEEVLKQLRAMGLTGGAYNQLAASGNLAQAQAYLAMGPDAIQALVRDFKERQDALKNLGRSVGNARFGADIREQLKVTQHAARVAEESRDELRAIKNAQRDITQRLDRIEKNSPKETGKAVAGAVNGAVGNGKQRGVGG